MQQYSEDTISMTLDKIVLGASVHIFYKITFKEQNHF